MKPDYLLYLVTDRECIGKGNLTLYEAVEQAILGGCSMVQLRETDISSADFYDAAERMKRITDRYGIPLIVNNRADIALAVGAAGVHIGQRDIPVSPARKLIGKDMLLGVSVTSAAEALRAQEDGADYLGVGAMFPTKTKKDAKIVPMEELCAVRRAVRIPIVAIGGIRRENAAKFLELGVDGVAVISAILGQWDIRRAAAELRAQAEEAAGKRHLSQR